ncbi:MAG: transaldolase [Gammaproteobacteria bacterium]
MTRPHNSLRELMTLGQSVWLDFIDRALIEGGGLARLIDEDGVCGLTSNPAIFEQAVATGGAYDAEIDRLAAAGLDAAGIVRSIAVADIQAAADLLRPAFVTSATLDGYASLEVSPDLARDAAATMAEARALWRQLARPNVMIKVPATQEALPAIQALIAEGINVNVTLLFDVGRYRAVADAWLAGLERRAAAGVSVASVASVASFFVSRIDTAVDGELERAGRAGAALRGEAAIACARMAYEAWREIHAEPRWQALLARGAQPQRLLWASTGTKDPAHADVKYVEALIGPHTVTTLPPATLEAFRHHGRARPTLARAADDARMLPARLAARGVDLAAVAARLEAEGIGKFALAHRRLLNAIQARLAPGSL